MSPLTRVSSLPGTRKSFLWPQQRGWRGHLVQGNGFLPPPTPLYPLRKAVVPFISLAKRQRECLILYLKFLVPTVSVPSSQRTLNGYLKSFCETETEQRQQGGKDSKLKECFKIHSLIYSILLAFFFAPTKSRSAHRNISIGGKWYNVPTLCSNPNHSNQLRGSR